MPYSTIINQLISALRTLPGVGPRSAQRMAFHLLKQGRADALLLAKTLETAINQIGHCQNCRNFSEEPICNICANQRRIKSLLCVVETPADIIAIEQTSSYKGLYFVLMGHLSPIDGIGPNELGIAELQNLLAAENFIEEVILATNSTVEGEATAHYIANIVRNKKIKCSRIAHGIPMGGELEYIDSSTLARALNGRLAYDLD